MRRFFWVLSVIVMVCFFSGFAHAGINDGLVAYYPFNGNADDDSGNGKNGTVMGATLTTDRFGNANSAFSFDGVDDYIDIGSFPINFDYTTVSFWIKTTKGLNNLGVLTIGGLDKNIGGIQVAVGNVLDGHTENKIKFAFRDNKWTSAEGKYPFLESSTTVSDGEWHHITFVYDGNGTFQCQP